MIFFVPLLGMAVGAGMGALGGSLADVGIDEAFINTVREKVTPGTSALFLLTSGATEDRMIEELRQFDFEIISTNLPEEEEQKLREAFGEEPYDVPAEPSRSQRLANSRGEALSVRLGEIVPHTDLWGRERASSSP